MKRYFIILWDAVCGRKLYREEQSLLEIKKQVSALQTLVENLRERLAEKETLQDLIKHDYQKRIREMRDNYNRQIDMYTKEITELQKENIG